MDGSRLTIVPITQPEVPTAVAQNGQGLQVRFRHVLLRMVAGEAPWRACIRRGGAGTPPSTTEEEKPRWKEDPSEPGYGADYARDHLPRFPLMPWTAPIFDERQIVADPQLVCAEAGAGEGVNGNWREASCTCLTEQGTSIVRHAPR